MDKNILVANGRALIDVLSGQGAAPRAALWVYGSETDTWQLWIVPHKSIANMHEFYRQISTAISQNPDSMGSLDPADIKFVKDDHPAIQDLGKAFRIRSGSVEFQSCVLNGFFMPDCIILVMNL